MRVNGFYIFIGLLFLAMLWISTRYFKGAGHSFVGVAVAKEFKITVEKASQIKKIAVVPGQQVKSGDLLVEVTSTSLDIEVDKLAARLAALRSEQSEKAKLAYTEEELIKAELVIKMGELDTEILQKEEELKLNNRLTKDFAVTTTQGASPLEETIKSLKQQKTSLRNLVDIQVKSVRMQNETNQLVLTNQVQLLQRELDLLLNEKKSLNKYATGPGLVESILVKEGEHIEAYTPLVSINPLHPATVVGYLVGKKEKIEVGSDVEVRSYETRAITLPGRVIGFGSVVPLPDILQKATASKTFGQEVFIEIIGENLLASGERVLIR